MLILGGGQNFTTAAYGMELTVALGPPCSARAAGLVYTSRRRAGHPAGRQAASAFTLSSTRGASPSNAERLARIRSLVIPPAWTDVWICPDPRGHLQATGRDARGRKQYRYHPKWRKVRDDTKYGRLIAFGQALPVIRRRTDADLRAPGLPREKVLAAVVKLLEKTFIRVGNDEYARDNRSFGLTTMRDGHVRSCRAPRCASSSAARAASSTSSSWTIAAWRRSSSSAAICRGRSCSSTATTTARVVDIGSADVNALPAGR